MQRCLKYKMSLNMIQNSKVSIRHSLYSGRKHLVRMTWNKEMEPDKTLPFMVGHWGDPGRASSRVHERDHMQDQVQGSQTGWKMGC